MLASAAAAAARSFCPLRAFVATERAGVGLGGREIVLGTAFSAGLIATFGVGGGADCASVTAAAFAAAGGFLTFFLNCARVTRGEGR